MHLYTRKTWLSSIFALSLSNYSEAHAIPHQENDVQDTGVLSPIVTSFYSVSKAVLIVSVMELTSYIRDPISRPHCLIFTLMMSEQTLGTFSPIHNRRTISRVLTFTIVMEYVQNTALLKGIHLT